MTNELANRMGILSRAKLADVQQLLDDDVTRARAEIEDMRARHGEALAMRRRSLSEPGALERFGEMEMAADTGSASLEALEAELESRSNAFIENAARTSHEIRVFTAAHSFLTKRAASGKDYADTDEAVVGLARAMLSIDEARVPAEPRDLGPSVDGVYPLDERYAQRLAQLGPRGAALAAAVRRKSTGRSREESAARWENTSEDPLRFLAPLADAIWVDVVEPQLKRLDSPSALTVMVTSSGYAQMPKTLSPMSWAMGAPANVVIDDDRYAEEPGVVTKLVPRTMPLLAEMEGHERRPHQTVLPLWGDDLTALPVAVAGATSYAISPQAAKLALVALASDDVRTGRMAKTTLGELAQWTHPHVQRLKSREIRAVAEGLDELRRIFVFVPDGTKVQVFDTTSAARPEEAQSDLEVLFGLTRTFAAVLMNGMKGGTLKGTEYRGNFLINLTGAMRIPAKNPSQLRHYIRAASHWNAAYRPGSGGIFDPAMMRSYTLEQWSVITNSLPPGVVEVLAARSARAPAAARKRISDAKKAVRDDLEALEASGLLVVEKHGRDGIKILPPAAYLEAWNESRKAGRRPGPTPRTIWPNPPDNLAQPPGQSGPTPRTESVQTLDIAQDSKPRNPSG